MINKIDVIKRHIELKSFGLKDYNKTFNKYKDYKPLKVTDFLNKFDSEIKEFLENELYEQINEEVYKKSCFGMFIFDDIKNHKISKSVVNYFKTLINSITYEKDYNFIKELGEDLNKNELRCFTIIFYLRFYKEINEIMKQYLKDYLIERL